ncbi:aconitate hydratase AcnA [Geopsychrobacter electrodiphilus]|uniref:aconitate hydratase AcnA n=1 Tax=Geopsychrobacter electrodiphilus TaxID=225196 RepID=UPI00035F4183|nr:aconitate hydratase AcnA [Geopsychrobacter electrodiphilus]
MRPKPNSCHKTLKVKNQTYSYCSLSALAQEQGVDLTRLPKTIRILVENLLRNLDGSTSGYQQLEDVLNWRVGAEIAYRPARVLMQDFTGVPAIVDLAAMRDAVVAAGGNPAQINPQIPVDLVIDHSVMVDQYGSGNAYRANVEIEMERNRERYAFLRWGQKSFDNFRVVPPGTGICHQVNLEYLAQAVWTRQQDGKILAYPDTLVGTDSHTTMINGLGVLGWGVGGIEAEAAMLGQPISMLIPEVVGFRLDGSLREGITATDLVLTVTQQLRSHGVVGKFVEFFGPGLDQLPLADRATIANMAPEYGATCGFFPIDRITLDYLQLTGRDAQQIALVESYCREQGLWRESGEADPEFTTLLTLDLGAIVPSLAGPKRPQDRVALPDLKRTFDKFVPEDKLDQQVKVGEFTMSSGDVVIAAITSCTNTSNPAVMMAAGLVAQKAQALGLTSKPWVKTSLAPGSKVVTDYLAAAGLQSALDALGFQVVGYGCTTCIGNSGPLKGPIADAISENDLWVSSVLSGNRNFEGRIHQQVKANWLASPPLVVAYALAGTTRIDLSSEPLGIGSNGKPVFLKDIWPSNAEVAEKVQLVAAEMFHHEYAEVFEGDDQWRELPVPEGQTYAWDEKSTYIRQPSFFRVPDQLTDFSGFKNARILALLGDSITTDHISPAGAIKGDSPAGLYLQEHGIAENDFNSYGSRRGNHEVMMRGTFANIRLRNKMVPDLEGGFTHHLPDGKPMSIFDAAMKYAEVEQPLVVIAGREYGTGSSRDWAAKGTLLLGVKAVIAESYERIHRSNLVGMGILPLQFVEGANAETLGLNGEELISLPFSGELKAKMHLPLVIQRPGGGKIQIELLCRIDTEDEVAYYRSGGILNYVLGRLV